MNTGNIGPVIGLGFPEPGPRRRFHLSRNFQAHAAAAQGVGADQKSTQPSEVDKSSSRPKSQLTLVEITQEAQQTGDDELKRRFPYLRIGRRRKNTGDEPPDPPKDTDSNHFDITA